MQYRVSVTSSLRHGRNSSARTLEPSSSYILHNVRAPWCRRGSFIVCRRRIGAFHGIQEPHGAWLDGHMLVIQSIGQQERTVPIPRWVAEKMLVERYRDMLSTMSDEDVAKLFEQQGVGLKEFPQGLVGNNDSTTTNKDDDVQRSSNNSNIEEKKSNMVVVESRDAGASPPASSEIVRGGGGEEEDETAALLGEREDGLATNRRVDRVEEGGGVSALLQNVDSKNVALIAMGTGGLVLGTALMYMLISTLSGSAASTKRSSESFPRKIESEKKEDAGEQRNGNETASIPPDPYTMYTTVTTGGSPDSEGGVIWERKEKSPATQDLWRVPMEDLKSPQAEDEPRRGEVAAEQRDVRHAKRPPAFEDILDNAESISVGHKKSRSKNIS
ncbi:hypothetical protein PSENEW3_00003016 [Picochlorum sp. SENEW3]|nr:hypothetical protein PSENEW3_00003016 [Picochlorum sp. SENEW3]